MGHPLRSSRLRAGFFEHLQAPPDFFLPEIAHVSNAEDLGAQVALPGVNDEPVFFEPVVHLRVGHPFGQPQGGQALGPQFRLSGISNSSPISAKPFRNCSA